MTYQDRESHGAMYDFQIAGEVAAMLTCEDLVRLDLSVSSRQLSCAVCMAPLGAPRRLTSVFVVRDPSIGRAAVRLAHAACARSEVREEAMGDCGSANGPAGHEWNLIRRAHPEVPAVLAWEPRPGFERSLGAPSRPFDSDAIARGLRRSGFTRASGSISSLLPTPLCGMTLLRTGGHLVLLRNRRRWLEFSEAATREGSNAWLAEATRGGRVLLLYGPGLGGEALAPDSLARALTSGTALCATVRMQEPHAGDSLSSCRSRSLASTNGSGSIVRRPRGAHRPA